MKKVWLSISDARRVPAWWQKLNRQEQLQYLAQHKRSQLKVTATEALGHGIPLAEYAKSKDDPSVTEDHIYAMLHPEDAHEIQRLAEENERLLPTNKAYTDEHGNYKPERLALHKQIEQTILSAENRQRATPKPGKKPKFIILGGRGGSGKSSFSFHEDKEPKIKEFDSREFIVMDADEIKKQLIPPYNGTNAFQVHEESTHVFDRIILLAKDLGLNVISDATLKSDKMRPQIAEFKEQDYEIEGHYMFLPRQKAAERAAHRYLGKGADQRGRLVPPKVVLENTNNESNFDLLKPLLSRWSAYDNDQPRGQPPKLIDHSDLYQQETRSNSEPQELSMNNDYENKPGDRWENDPYLTNTRTREYQLEVSKQNLVKRLFDLRIKPKEVKNEETRKRYVAYLKSLL